MISDEILASLKKFISSSMSESRYRHTLGVLDMALFIADFCLPEKKKELSVAALLHDVTKELSWEEQTKILSSEGVVLSALDIESPAVIHSYTAPYFVKKHFPNFATDEILSAIEKHTVGGSEMSVFDEIIFLSDFIELGRKYESSVKTREFVIRNMIDGKTSENIKILHKASIMEIDFTIEHLKEKGATVHESSLLARKYLSSLI